MTDLPPAALDAPVTRWVVSPDWITALNGEPIFQTVGGRFLLVAIRWADDCAPEGFTRLAPGVFFPDRSAAGQAWQVQMSRTRPTPAWLARVGLAPARTAGLVGEGR